MEYVKEIEVHSLALQLQIEVQFQLPFGISQIYTHLGKEIVEHEQVYCSKGFNFPLCAKKFDRLVNGFTVFRIREW